MRGLRCQRCGLSAIQLLQSAAVRRVCNMKDLGILGEGISGGGKVGRDEGRDVFEGVLLLDG